MLYICVKFHENISGCIKAMAWAQMMEALTVGQMDVLTVYTSVPASVQSTLVCLKLDTKGYFVRDFHKSVCLCVYRINLTEIH